MINSEVIAYLESLRTKATTYKDREILAWAIAKIYSLERINEEYTGKGIDNSAFSHFIRKVSPEEKEQVFRKVVDEVVALQKATIDAANGGACGAWCPGCEKCSPKTIIDDSEYCPGCGQPWSACINSTPKCVDAMPVDGGSTD